MKPEEFDDAIRQKLESIHPTYSSSDIDKVFNHVRKSRRFPWKGASGSWLFYTFSAAAMVGITAWMVHSWTGNDKKPAKPEIQLISKPSVPAADTAVAPGTVQNQKSPAGNLHENSQPLRLKHAQTEPAGKPLPGQKAMTAAPASPGKLAASSQSPAFISINTDKEPVLNFAKQPEIKEVAAGSSLHKQEMGKDIPVKIPREDTREIPAEGKPANQNLIAENKETVQASEPKIRNEIINQNPDSANPAKPLKSKAPKAGIKAISLLSSNKVGLSLYGKVSSELSGLTLGAEMLHGQHFGVTAGVSYTNLKTERFTDKADFDKHKRPGFNEKIENHMTDPQHISDITIHNTMVQLPLAVSYRIPLKRDFSLRLSLGTDLDLLLNQNLTFNHRVDSARKENQFFRATGKVVPLNNLVFGASLSRQWGKWSVSLQPYYTRQVKQVFYKPKDNEFGLGLGLKYSFGH